MATSIRSRIKAPKLKILPMNNDKACTKELRKTLGYFRPDEFAIYLKSKANYVLLHELAHAAGKKLKCERFKGANYLNKVINSIEELIAELTCFYLCMDLGVKLDPNRAQYADDYMKNIPEVIRDDVLFFVMNKARQRHEYIMKNWIVAGG